MTETSVISYLQPNKVNVYVKNKKDCLANFALSESPPIPAILCTYVDRINDAVLLFDKSFVTANLKGTPIHLSSLPHICVAQ